MAEPHTPARRLALMNQKGGVGKTTTTVNLAAAIAELGRRTLLVDLDPQAHATLHLGVDPGNAEQTVYDALHRPDETPTPLLAKPNLWLLPSETDLAAAESELAGIEHRFTLLRTALAKLEDNFDFMLLDCPPSLGLLTLNALNAAREVLIPMQAQFLALQGVGKLLETVQLVSQKLNPQLRVAGIVLCMYDKQATHSREVVDDLQSFLDAQRELETPWKGARVYDPPVRRNIKLAECPSFGQTIFEYAPWASGAMDYRQIAEELVAEWDRAIAMRDQRLRASASESPAQPETPRTATGPVVQFPSSRELNEAARAGTSASGSSPSGSHTNPGDAHAVRRAQ